MEIKFLGPITSTDARRTIYLNLSHAGEHMKTENAPELIKLLHLETLPKLEDASLRKKVTDLFLTINHDQKQTPRRMIAIAGAPGAGKSFFYEQMKTNGQLPPNAFIYDPDLIMEAIPQYLNEAMINPIEAFQHWELPARQLANEILMKAILANSPIVYIRSLALPDSLDLIRYIKTINYQLEIHLLTCDQEIAISRVKKREKITKRHLPTEVLIQRHEAFTKLLPDIIKIADHYYVYENNVDGQLPILKYSSLS